MAEQKRTVELEELVVVGLGGKLLAVDDGRLEGFALRGRHDGGFRRGLKKIWGLKVVACVVLRLYSGTIVERSVE